MVDTAKNIADLLPEKLEHLEMESGTAKFDLTLTVREDAGLAVVVVQEQASEVAEDEMAQLIAELDYLSDDDALSQVSS